MSNWWFATRDELKVVVTHGPFTEVRAVVVRDKALADGKGPVSILYQADDQLKAFLRGELST
ncbi:hypothetical protein I9H06_10855 [Pseudomonas tremae]|uniref:hypothetical protein n=1 Tax=Pseudomonas tremae TaxID=200454 RepID=UPI001F4516B6|nr:hypothetical protein [Pseudomonas tremae]MCF5715462.1 hypothetical protein [Pseudomonas tremae]UQB33694.1 hypothetical protein I9H06_10855 [Pseudomonas tremae]